MSGMMNPQPKQDDLLEQFRRALGPTTAAPATLSERLKGLSEAELSTVKTITQMVKMIASMQGGQQQSYQQIIDSSYPLMNAKLKAVVVELLQDADPRPVTMPEAKQEAVDVREALLQNYYAVLGEADTSKSTDVAPTDNPSLVQKPQTSVKSFSGKDDFLAHMTPIAKEVAAELGISHRVVLAQAALESGWGQSVKNNNFFGIKSHGKSGGAKVITHEVIDGQRVKITDSFRQYETPEDSIRGYGDFLRSNKRYKGFLQAGVDNEEAQLQALQASGYATDPAYADKLADIIKGLPDDNSSGGGA